MRKIDRLSKYMEHKKLNDNVVTKECSLAQGLLGKARSGRSDLGSKAIDKILEKYQDLDRVWLLTGEGEMLKQDKPKSEDTSLLQQLVDSLKATIETQKALLDAKQAEIERLQRAMEEKFGKEPK